MHVSVQIAHPPARLLPTWRGPCSTSMIGIVVAKAGDRSRGNSTNTIAKPECPIDLTERVEQIHSHADFVAFSNAFLKDLKEKPEGWENRDLAGFLEALAAWVQDMNGYYQAKGGTIPLQPSWKMLGQILLAAKVYE